MPLTLPQDGSVRWSSQDPWTPEHRPPGAFPPTPNPDGVLPSAGLQSVNETLKSRKDEYLRKKTIKVKVGTWNVAAMGGARKDLGGWFAQGLGVKGMSQDLTGLGNNGDDSGDEASTDSELETIEEQEDRANKKSTTLPKNDSPGVASGTEVDLYVLGLQEVIDITSMTEAMKPFTDPNPARRWKSAMRKNLPKGYKKVVEEQLLGLLLLVFASPELAPQISSVDSTHVGTGLMGYLGNKGAVSTRILLGEATRLLFVNCHLAAGADATALGRRIWDAGQIVTKTKFAPVGDEWVGSTGRPESIGDEDYAFWFGDLNYRLDDIPGEDVRRLLLLHARNEYDISNASRRRIDSELGKTNEPPANGMASAPDELPDSEPSAQASTIEPALDPENDPASLVTTLKSLLTHDQLRGQQRLKKAFHEGWREGDINFLPTYKYDVGSVAMFDSSEKKRSPSWCDRILFRTRLDYERYKTTAKQEAEAKKRDDDMKQRGLDDAASQDNILFDYDPETDGVDDYDDDVDQYDVGHDMDLVRTRSVFEDTLTLEEYVSHQRVLSSDHKPLTAVFRLTYDSVDPGLKAKVFQEITRDFDKAENEARPSVTLVVDHASQPSATTDKYPDASESSIVNFDQVRYGVQYEHHLTIANTGQIEVVYAFMDRPIEAATGVPSGPFPSWLKVEVHQNPEQAKTGPQDLGKNQRFRLYPGETTNIDLLVEINQPQMVIQLNSGDLVLDDVLVLRVSNGRDHFIPIRGSWQQTCFHRTIDELVRVPAGVRKLTLHTDKAEVQQRPAQSVVHSAPQELFTLTDVIPRLTERVVAEWDICHDEDPPWRGHQPWPFLQDATSTADFDMRAERLAEIRESLDTAEGLDSHLSPQTDPVEKLALLSETLVSFLASLRDGLITSTIWNTIEARLQMLEKSKSVADNETLQDIVMEAMSAMPVHSVSLTFMAFMLNNMLNSICSEDVEQAQSATKSSGRSRSSTSASAMSDVSLSSVRSSGSDKRSFLFLGRRSTNMSSSSSIASPVSPSAARTMAVNTERGRLAHGFAELFAPLVVRSDETKLGPKQRKMQLTRKVKVLEAFLYQEF